MRVCLSFFALVLLVFSDFVFAASINQSDQIDHSGKIFRSNIFYSNTEKDDGLFAQFFDKQNGYINILTCAINEEGNSSSESALRLFNRRGTVHLFMGKFEDAIEDFTHVINVVNFACPKEVRLLNTALWGRMLCHAFMGHCDHTRNDAFSIISLVNESSCDQDNLEEVKLAAFRDNYPTTVRPIAKFAHPKEVIGKYECHDRVQSISGKMQSLADLIPEQFTRKTVIWVIEVATEKAHNCCDTAEHWTECLGSVVDVWKKLEGTWDTLVDLFKRGIDIKEFLTSPLNL